VIINFLIIIQENDGYQLKIKYKPSNVKISSKDVKWSSSDDDIAGVDEEGYVYGYTEGTATITAKIGNKKTKCKVTVKPAVIDVDSIDISDSTLEMTVGEEKQLYVTIHPDNATEQNIIWSSSNDKIVSVDKNGLVKAVSEGTADIIATVDGIAAKCKVKIKKTYTTGDNVSASDIVYISDRSVEYNSVCKEYRVFFSLKLSDGNTRVATSGNTQIKIKNNKNQVVYTQNVKFSQRDFGYWTSQKWGERYLCCIHIPINDIKNGATRNGILDFTVYIGRDSWNGEKHSVNNLPVGYDSTVNAEPESQEKYNENFDKIVSYVKKNGTFSTYGSYCTYGYLSVSMSGDKIEIFENYNGKGNKVTLTRGSKTAIAVIKGMATAEFDISTFKGDATDMLQWSDDPSLDVQFVYDTAIANILKNVSKNDNFYMGGYCLQNIGFISYIY